MICLSCHIKSLPKWDLGKVPKFGHFQDGRHFSGNVSVFRKSNKTSDRGMLQLLDWDQFVERNIVNMIKVNIIEIFIQNITKKLILSQKYTIFSHKLS